MYEGRCGLPPIDMISEFGRKARYVAFDQHATNRLHLIMTG